MSTTTTNYGLIKPDTTDPILIGQLNDNSDAIDAALKENADAIENKPDAADIPSPSTAAPAMDGTAAAGTSTDYARADHVHPSDTSKQDALTTFQLDAVNSGIDSTKVAQIETNKNNISYIENTGKKNWLKPDTILGVPTGITVQYESDDSITINGTYSGSEYAYVHLHSFAYEAMQYTFSCNVATSASTFYFSTLDNKMSTNLTPTYIYTENGTTRVVMRIAPNTSFDNVNVKLMIRPSIITDSTYQPYALSNAELTALVLKVASVTYSLNDLTWTASLDGMIYSNATVVNGITSVYSAIITGFARLRATDVIIPILSNDGTQIRFMANTGSWVTDAEIKLRIVGV